MSDQASARPITELRVTASVMVLEAGTYCAFVAPGSPTGGAVTGLPAVRLTAAPGTMTGRIAIAGFGESGLLTGRDDAVLVRVMGGAASLLVTVYQGSDAAVEAPKVQVLRLSHAAAPTIVPGPAIPAATAFETMAHIYGRGDVGGRFGEWIGEPESRRWIEGFALKSNLLSGPSEMEYQAVLGRGWLSPWVEAGEFCGSRGMSLPILGLNVRLAGKAAARFDAVVSARFVDGTVVGPVSDQPVEAPSLAALEAFHIVLERKAGEARG